MNYRNLNTYVIDIDTLQGKIMPYMFLECIPVDWYKDVLKWSENELCFDNMTTTITDNKGFKNLTVVKNPVIVSDGIGYCEIELRGFLVDLDTTKKKIKISNNFLPVLHYSTNNKAMCLVLSGYNDTELGDFILSEIIPILRTKFKKVEVVEGTSDIDISMTKYIDNDEDMLSFLDDSVMNIVTAPFSLNKAK